MVDDWVNDRARLKMEYPMEWGYLASEFGHYHQRRQKSPPAFPIRRTVSEYLSTALGWGISSNRSP